VIKKQNLHSYDCRSQNSLHFGLGNRLDPYSGGHSASCGPISKGKADTYSVEVDNAELRHYLARLARQSRCFSRCPYALECALRLFVFCFNSRQLHKQHFPTYVAHVMDFVPDTARRFVEAAHEAHGLVWCSPTYHAVMSSAFKNALDWFELLRNYEPPYLTDKIIGLISTAGGTTGLQAINTMEFVVRALRSWAIPIMIPCPKSGSPLTRAVGSSIPTSMRQPESSHFFKTELSLTLR
jgi:NAD(P)H-dependent FMN reductase